MTEIVQLTKERKAELERELHDLKSVKRVDIIDKLQFAKSLGDLSENAEYHAAREAQGKNETRIQEIESMLKNAVIVAHHHTEVADITSKVVTKKKGDTESRTFTLVGPHEADMVTGKISIDSPIGKALLGKKAGDTTTVTSPNGSSVWSIISVE